MRKKRKFYLTLVFFLFCSTSRAAIATLDATSTFSDTDNNSTFSGSYTVSTGTNSILIFQGTWYGCGGSQRIITALTFNGDALTQATVSNGTADSCFQQSAVWYLINPDVGTYTLSGTLSTNTDGVWWALSTYSGVKQTGQPDATASEADTSGNDPSPHEQTITVVADNSWIFDATISWSITSPAASGGQTENWATAGSYKAATTAGSYTMGWTYSGTGSFTHALSSFAPVVTSRKRMIIST